MASVDQIRANRENAKSSTGPRTAEGRERVAENPVRHGLTSSRVLAITRDEKEELEHFVVEVRNAFQPVGPLEGLMADRLVSLLWRLRRLSRIEGELLVVESSGVSNTRLRWGVAFARASGGSDSFAKLGRYESTLHRAFLSTLRELERLQRARAGEAVMPPVSVDVNVHGES